MRDNEDTELGRQAAHSYYNSQAFAGYTRQINAKDAIKLFLPPVKEIMTQIASPLPKPRKDWIKGFKAEQVTILGELNAN